MNTAAIVYRSRTGTTQRYAEQIGAHLRTKGIQVVVGSVGDLDPRELAKVDFVLLGCWTNGLMVILQHPDQPWIAFAREIPALGSARVALFTTYTMRTGSMFRKMRAELGQAADVSSLELKSRDGSLSAADRAALDAFVA